ncbi:MAG: GDP-L-fucose synthase family protein [bacterium]
MEKKASIYVAGHRGLAGSAILRRLKQEGYTNLILKTHRELDLTRQHEVEAFFEKERPEYVFMAAAKVGGIYANDTYSARFIYENLMIQSHMIECAYRSKCVKLLFLGSSCIYPKAAYQPIKEEYLLQGELEPTNKAYAVAKIAGITMCQSYRKQYGANFICAMPTNLYGINDNFHSENSHVLPALIRKIHEAKSKGEKKVEIWGTGKPYREFLYVDDLADACLFLMNNYQEPEIINVGTGQDVSILELACIIKEVIGYEGDLVFDPSKPDGTPRKLLDVSRLSRLGWQAKVDLREGIKITYKWYLEL